MLKPAIIGVARHLLTLGAGILIARGTISAADAEILTGAVIAIVGVGLSIYDKRP